jgi:hypothetical protein
VAAHIIEHHRHLILGQLLDQPEQLIALHAHEASVRRPSPITLSLRRAVVRPIERWAGPGR